MDILTAANELIRLYPRIYLSCHRRHVRDPQDGRVLSSHLASVLDHLDTHEPTYVLDLASHMGVSASTMSLTLDRLESPGYIARRRDSHDARKVGIILTKAGDRVRKAGSVLDPELVLRLVGSLSAEERKRAIEGLTLLSAAATRTGGVRHSAVRSASHRHVTRKKKER